MENSRPMLIEEEKNFIESEIGCLTRDLEKITKLKNNITIQIIIEADEGNMKKNIPYFPYYKTLSNRRPS